MGPDNLETNRWCGNQLFFFGKKTWDSHGNMMGILWDIMGFFIGIYWDDQRKFS